MANNIIRVSEAAVQMNRDKSSFFKMLKREGIPIRLVYDERDEARGQRVAVIKRSDYEILKDKRDNPTW